MTFPLATERTPAPATPRADSALGDTLLAQALLAHADLQGLAVAVKSADDGCYLSGNAAFAGLCGSDPTAVPGRTDADWLDATTAALLRKLDLEGMISAKKDISEVNEALTAMTSGEVVRTVLTF